MWQATKALFSESVLERAKSINAYMISLGKEKIFETGDNIDDTDFKSIIEKYEYLMSKSD